MDHLETAAPWNVHVTVDLEAIGSPFQAAVGGLALEAMGVAMAEAYGKAVAMTSSAS